MTGGGLEQLRKKILSKGGGVGTRSWGAADLSYSISFSTKSSLHFDYTFVSCIKRKEMGGDICVNMYKKGGVSYQIVSVT